MTAAIVTLGVLEGHQLRAKLLQLVRGNHEEILIVVNTIVSHPVDLATLLVDDQVVGAVSESEAHGMLGCHQAPYGLQGLRDVGTLRSVASDRSFNRADGDALLP